MTKTRKDLPTENKDVVIERNEWKRKRAEERARVLKELEKEELERLMKEAFFDDLNE